MKGYRRIEKRMVMKLFPTLFTIVTLMFFPPAFGLLLLFQVPIIVNLKASLGSGIIMGCISQVLLFRRIKTKNGKIYIRKTEEG